MGRIVRCAECGEVYEELKTLENLRDNDAVCVVCNAPVEVADWDRVLSSYDDDDFDDVDALGVDDSDDEWTGDVEIDVDFDADHETVELDDDDENDDAPE